MTRFAARTRVPVGWLCCWLLCFAGCDRSDTPKPTPPKPSASVSKQRAVVVACKAARPGAHFTVGTSGQTDDALADAGSDVELPFAVELGGAARYQDGYAVSVLTSHRDGSVASVAVVSRLAEQGKVVALGDVHGDVVPPHLAVVGDQLIAAVVDNDAGSQTLRLLAVQPSAPEPVAARSPTFDQGRDDSSAFDLAFSEKRGLLVWDRYDKPRGHAVLEAASFAPSDVTEVSEPKVVSYEGDDAELPRLIPRKGGYWLIYVAHGAPPPEAPDDPDAAVGNVVDITPRRLTILPLDAAGVATGSPERLTGEASHVLAYDAVGHGSGVLVAWRDDPTALGVEAPVVHVAQVRADGSFQTARLENSQFGAGAPVLLVDPTDAKTHPWLGVMGQDQLLGLSTIEVGPKVGAPASLPETERGAEPMLRNAGEVLLARPRGRVVDLSVTRCVER